jgi:uncharacterized protein
VHGWHSPGHLTRQSQIARPGCSQSRSWSPSPPWWGCVGGIYGIGGGSILAPILIGSGRRPAEVAPAALASTFVTSVAGVITFTILSIHQHGPVAPDWPTGIALGIGGLAGGYTGARIQHRLPDLLIRRLVGVLVVAIGIRYAWSVLG